MAEMETVTVLKVKTLDAVENVNDLKNNIKLLKEELGTLTIGTTKYQEKLSELQHNQDALKSAMNATKGEISDITKVVDKNGKSYNSLVHEMAAYKAQMRNVDTSTEEGKAAFAKLAEKINDCNDELKAMDELQGNFKRNVGNYQTAIKGLGTKIDGLVKGFKAAKSSAEGMKRACDAASKTPLLVILGLLVSAATNLVSKFKETEEGTEAIEAAMVNLEPIADFFRGLIEKVSEILGDIITKVATFVGSNGVFQKVIGGITGVGNAIVQFLIWPIKQFVAGVKGLGKIFEDIFKGNFKNLKADAEAFGQSMSDAFTKGFAFKANFEAGKKGAENFIEGISSPKTKKKAYDSGREIAEEVNKGVIDGLMTPEEMDKLMEQHLRELEAEIKARDAENAELTKMTEEMWEETNSAIDDYINEQLEAERRQAQEEAMLLEARRSNYIEFAGCVGDIFGSIAQIYENDSKDSEKAFEMSKKFQLAETWVSTLSGMVAAVRSVWQDKTVPTVLGKAALASANAGAILASGIATTAKIKSTTFGGGGVSSGSVPQVATASVSAPSIQASLPQMVQIPTWGEGNASKVYILQSDIEAAGNKARVRDGETTL